VLKRRVLLKRAEAWVATAARAVAQRLQDAVA
jgi:hypothetical protein